MGRICAVLAVICLVCSWAIAGPSGELRDPGGAGSGAPQGISASGLTASAAAGAAFTLSLIPSDDAFVWDGNYANSNFGLATPLQLNSSSKGFNRDAYLKFDLSGVTNIIDAHLRVYAAANQTNLSIRTSIYAVTNSLWKETNLTWNTRPPLDTLLASFTVGGTNYAWYDIPILSYVQSQKALGRNSISLGLDAAKMQKTQLVTLFSKETASNTPLLLLTITNTPPAVSLTSPANNASYVFPSPIVLTATASDSGGSVSRVEFYAGSTLLGTDSNVPYTLTWSNAPPGSYALTAVATDNNGLAATSSIVNVTVRSSLSTSLSSPPNNATYVAGEAVPLAATASTTGGSISKVDFFDGPTLLFTTTASPYTYAWKNASPGNHLLTTRATDNFGNTATSSVIVITIADADSDYDGISNSQEIADGTDPFDPASVQPVRLGSWRFDTPAFLGDQGQVPLYSYGVSLVPGWQSNAVSIPFQAVCSGLTYREVETNWSANFNCWNGSVRFWFRPHWTSTAGGVVGGPRTDARLLEVGGYGVSEGWWFLGLNPDGTRLGFSTMSNLNYTSYFDHSAEAASLYWVSNHWYQITLTYSPSNTALYINGELLASGGGIQSIPSPSIRTNGVRLGWDYYCLQSPFGDFDLLETFNYCLDARAVAAGYPNGQTAALSADSDYDGRSDFLETQVDGTNPNNAKDVLPVRLGYWRFNNPTWVGEQGQAPLSQMGVQAVPSWSGSAAFIPSTPSAGLIYRETEPNGWANLNCRNGTVRFWFQPHWNSASNDIGGGPGNTDRLIEVGGFGLPDGWWSLGVNSDGTRISFHTMTNLNYTTYFTAPINWVSNHWYQIALTYSPTNSALYLNGNRLATGMGIQSYPKAAARANGFCLGLDKASGLTVNGAFDELETFNYPLSAAQIAEDYQPWQEVDQDLDGILDFVEDPVLPQSSPFSVVPFAVAGTIEAEAFDLGGPGVSYSSQVDHQTTAYRTTRLLIEPCDDLGGGYCVSQLQAGDWLQYTFVVLAAGSYTVEVRAAADTPGGAFRVQFETANGVANYRTTPVTIRQSAWQNYSLENIFLNAGTNVLRLLMLTNATDGLSGKVNYLSVYSFVPPYLPKPGSLFLNVTQPPYNAIGDGNSSRASSNRVAFQAALNDLQNNSDGGTLFVPAGTYFLDKDPTLNPGESPEKAVRNNAALQIGRGFLDARPAANIALLGDTAGESVLAAVDRTTTLLYVRRLCCIDPGVIYSNISISRITFLGRPHIRPGGSYDPGTFFNYASNSSLSTGLGTLVVFGSDESLAPISDVNIDHCRFRNPSVYGLVFGGVRNMKLNENQFHFWDGEPLPIASTNQYNATNGIPVGQVGVFGNGYPSLNMVVLSNSFNGNPSLMLTDSNLYCSDGLLWLQAGGNWFARGNVAQNFGLEAIQLNAGPGAATGNRFATTQQSGSTAALVAFAAGWPGVTGSRLGDGYFTFTGNDVLGGRSACLGYFAWQRLGDPLYTLQACGNTARLSPPVVGGPTLDGPSSIVAVGNCRQLFMSGNTLGSGDFGFLASLVHQEAEFLKNDFRQANLASILLYGPSGNLQLVKIAQCLLSSGEYAPPRSRVVELGSGFHLRLPNEDASRFFLFNNTFLDRAGNTNTVILDPPAAPVHFSP